MKVSLSISPLPPHLRNVADQGSYDNAEPEYVDEDNHSGFKHSIEE
jgi:hypothetical protein